MQEDHKQSEKLVSVVIVTYNAEKFINATIRSCLNQTYDNLEILVLDNHSIDRTVELIKLFNSDKIKIYENRENAGPYQGLNFLLNKARGNYIAIQDHDDIWLPEKIEKQAKFLEDNKEFIACGTDVFYYYEDKQYLILKQFQVEPAYVNHTSLFFRNQDFKYKTNVLLPEEHFERKILAQNGKIGCISEGLTIHRIRSDKKNLSRKRFVLNFKNIAEVLKINGFSAGNIGYILYLVFIRILPDCLVWKIRNNITMRNQRKIDRNTFLKEHPKIEL